MKILALCFGILMVTGLGAWAKPREIWVCKEEGISIHYSVTGKQLLGYEDDLTGKPNVYTIRKDTKNLVTATRHLPKLKGLVTITLDRRHRTLLETLKPLSGTYTERYTGPCRLIR